MTAVSSYGITEKIYASSLHQVEDWHGNYRLTQNQVPSHLKFEIALPGLDIPVLEQAYRQIIERHEILRTCFPKQGQNILQKVLDYTPLLFGIIHLDYLGDASPLIKRCQREIRRLKDLRNGPLVKAILIRKVAEGGFLFLFFIHHILTDLQGLDIFKTELYRAYERLKCGMPGRPDSPPLQFGQYIRSRNAYYESGQKNGLDFWMTKLRDRSWHVDYDRIYANIGISPGAENRSCWKNKYLFNHSKGEAYTVFTSPGLTSRIYKLSSATCTNIFSVLTAAFCILHRVLQDNARSLIGVIYTNRQDKRTEGMIGNFLSTLLLYLEADVDRTFRMTVIDCYAQLLSSADKLLSNAEKLLPLGIKSHCLLTINFLNKEMLQGEVRTLKEAVREYHVQATSPLYCVATEHPDSIVLRWEYNLHFYSFPLIEEMVRLYFSILDRITLTPDSPVSTIL